MATTLKFSLLLLLCACVQSLAEKSGHKWISSAVIPLKEWQDLDNRLQTLNRTKNSGVCLFVWTRLFSPVWDMTYLRKYLSWVKAVLFESMARQCSVDSPCNSLCELRVIVKIMGDNHNKMSPFFIHLKQSKTFFYFHHKNEKERTELDKRIKKSVAASNCQWVENIWVDADDGFADGFFQHITADLPGEIVRTGTKGKAWRGAIITGHQPNTLILGNNKCGSVKGEEDQPNIFYSGLSPAQGYILRRKVWDQLTVKVMYPGLHFLIAKQTRKFIMHGLGIKWSPSSSLVSKTAASEETGILLIDITRKSKKHSIFLETPFSSHFPWTTANQLPNCGPEQKRKMKDQYSKSIDYLLDATNTLYLSMKEVCKNNPNFGSASKFGLRCGV